MPPPWSLELSWGVFPQVKPGATYESADPAYKLLVEKHADNKIGVSVFLKEVAQAGR